MLFNSGGGGRVCGDGIREDTELSRWFIFLLETHEEPCFSKDKKISKMQTRKAHIKTDVQTERTNGGTGVFCRTVFLAPGTSRSLSRTKHRKLGGGQ